MNEYMYGDIEVGHKEQFSIRITNEMMELFNIITDDNNPLHTDMTYAFEVGYPNRVVYGMLTASFLSTLAGVYLPGKYSLIHDVSFSLPKPVFLGDELTIVGEVIDKIDTFKLIDLKVSITNQDNKKVLRGSMRIGFLDGR